MCRYTIGWSKDTLRIDKLGIELKFCYRKGIS